jgi:hypothetical protein
MRPAIGAFFFLGASPAIAADHRFEEREPSNPEALAIASTFVKLRARLMIEFQQK